MLACGAHSSRKAPRAILMLLKGSFGGTKRSSPMNQCTRCHGMRPRYGSVASNRYSRFGLDPPVRHIAVRPLAVILAKIRSAAVFANASGSGAAITRHLALEPIAQLSLRQR